ncbi:hypothetical protein JB92DRAFT_2952479 [Gautieria morchelliformis]|nr:hypothetical protein JB92DRAFT_2952479 [Gautieria morchelliformis]
MSPSTSHVTNHLFCSTMSENKKRLHDAGESGSQASSGIPPRKIQRLDSTPYPATPEEHAQMDNEVMADPVLVACGRLQLPCSQFAPHLITIIVGTSEDLNQKYHHPGEARSLLDTEGGLLRELQEAWNAKAFAPIRNLEILQPPRVSTGRTSSKPVLYLSLSERANQSAWKTPYAGAAHTSFIKTIDALYSKPNSRVYYNHVALIQSSGCGKSRMLHEASHHIHTVIMNFGSREAFPNPDTQVREYLVNARTEEQCENRVASFLASLFRALSKLDFQSPSELAEYLGYGDAEKLSQREAFFDAVISEASEIEQGIQTRTPPSPGETSPSYQSDGVERALAKATKTLIDKIPPQGHLNVKLLLGFDEASDLADPRKDWDVLEKTRRVFRHLLWWPIFGVSLSTTGSVKQFRPVSMRGKSSRMQDGRIYPRPPITLVDYDQLAMKLAEGKTLDDATTMEYMLSLGRPLFKTRYDAIWGFQYYNECEYKHNEDIEHFAIRKLLDGDDDTFHSSISIAPLAIRLPLEFNALTEDGREAERRQVESRMRICLKIEPFADIMYTVAPSEPVLIEAAAKNMKTERALTDRPVRVLHRFLSNRFLSKGDPAGLACMLLLLLARDMACRNLDTSRTPMRYHILVPVTAFLTNLFADGHKATVLDTQAYEGGPSLKEAFKDSWTHCTHFVKVTDHKVVNRKFLMRLMARGAGVLCADNQLEIDAIIPVCYKGKELVTENITVIAIRCRNAVPLHKPRDAIFTSMDPNHAGIFDKDHPGDIPIIKLVLSIATNTPVLTCPPWKRSAKTRSQSKDVPLSQQHFRFFAAGMSHEVFRPIQEEDEGVWRELLSCSDVADIYSRGAHESASDIMRRMTPGAHSDPRHWDVFFPLDFTAENMSVDVASDIDDESAD